jgi:hypothetical protein
VYVVEKGKSLASLWHRAPGGSWRGSVRVWQTPLGSRRATWAATAAAG